MNDSFAVQIPFSAVMNSEREPSDQKIRENAVETHTLRATVALGVLKPRLVDRDKLPLEPARDDVDCDTSVRVVIDRSELLCGKGGVPEEGSAKRSCEATGQRTTGLVGLLR